jgi:uncharacterized protein YcbK (DUF882 family)
MIDRRTLLFGAAAAAVSAETPAMAAETGAANCVWPPPNWQKGGFPSRRWVKILFVHTNERFADLYVDNGVYSMDAVKRFSWAVRDFRANESKLLDPRLMDLLFVLHWKYCKDEIRIFSGYRSGATNAHIEGAAKNSQHIQARALDIHLPNMDNDAVALDFRSFVFGGVGMYPGKQFTHMDMGNLRRWVG